MRTLITQAQEQRKTIHTRSLVNAERSEDSERFLLTSIYKARGCQNLVAFTIVKHLGVLL